MENQIKEIFDVSGMTCASCAISVEKIIKSQSGVKNVSVNLATNTAIIEYIPEKISKSQLKQATLSIGYGLTEENKDEDKLEMQKSNYNQAKKNLIYTAILSFPVFIFSMFLMEYEYANFIMLVFSIPVIFWFGRNFFISAYKKAKHFQSSMDTLVALSSSIAFIFSLFNMLYPEYWHKKGLHPHVYFESATVVITFILLGKLLEEQAKLRASASIKKLIGLQAKFATKIENEFPKEVAIKDLRIGDVLQIKPGSKIPVDGEILFGKSSVDESSISGEAIPLEKKRGDKVFAGTINQSGSFRMTTNAIGDDTLLGQIIIRVGEALMTKPQIQKLVDKIASIFVPVVILISIITFLIWQFTSIPNHFAYGIMSMVTVLIIACPCALGLATPTAIIVGIGKGADQGILIKDSDSLEIASKIDTIVFDKTGTITEGKPQIEEINWLIEDNINKYKSILYSIEALSEHPLAKVIAENLKGDTELIKILKYENISGKGIKAEIEGKYYFVGSYNFIIENNNVINHNNSNSNTIVYFADEDKLIAIIYLNDKIKISSNKAIFELKELNLDLYLLSGDNNKNVELIANQVGISNYYGVMLPHQKANYIKELQSKGKIVAMVGDGINDSEALAQANLSIAMGHGSDVAIDIANITLLNSDLNLVKQSIYLSKLTIKTIKQNLFWAFIYNIIGIPIAAGILYPINGYLLNPMIAGLAMAMSSVSVVTNSILMKNK